MSPSLGTIRRVRHLNCGTFRPFRMPEFVSHVLLCEYEHGVVLVDVGLGRDDVAHPYRRLGLGAKGVRPVLSADEPAAVQLHALGIAETDVSMIVATHLDYDHIGGAADFPTATVHVTGTELDAARRRPSLRERSRYRPVHIGAIDGRVQAHTAEPTATIVGFRAYPLDQGENLYLIPMPGHTAGHAMVAVHDPDRGWLIHAGDAFMHGSVLRPERARRDERTAQRAERMLAWNASALNPNHSALRDAAARPDLRVFCSHDRTQFDALVAESKQLARPRHRTVATDAPVEPPARQKETPP
ncbi:MBL fold metallo-hydrolase [Gordonia soli]|uniref:Metallo-beta-lactamase domain-containing protein n=1 Tax=Gordonia soli NBRC 108243 TaxID=1223545 RepID=M0QP67_9ACTN|nr:MBL fold metallo-hydrolase [Gordonia soli]GAC69237.1 hypothetical protein GS4_23_00310 [Gordonia soli NBRC 108243]